MIMDTLWWVVHDYLERNGLEHSKKKEDYASGWLDIDERYTIDTR